MGEQAGSAMVAFPEQLKPLYGLEPRQLRVWEVVLELPHHEVTRWAVAPP